MANESTTDTTGGNAAPAGTSGTSELDRLLTEFDKKPVAAPPDTNTALRDLTEAFKPVARFAEQKMQEEVRATTQKSIDDAISFVKGDEDLKTVSPVIVKGFMSARYADDQSFKTAFDNRGKDPKGWEAALTSTQADFKKEMGGSVASSTLRSDVDAATAAVRGANRGNAQAAQKVDPGKLRDMSDVEFARFKAQQARSR